jgi:hypothetical protein
VNFFCRTGKNHSQQKMLVIALTQKKYTKTSLVSVLLVKVSGELGCLSSARGMNTLLRYMILPTAMKSTALGSGFISV